jgi:ABC-type multidrug transport system ATPase subunit
MRTPLPTCRAGDAHRARLLPVLRDDRRQARGDLSGGEKTRLALATLVVSGANVLLLDEPTNNLDPASREEVLGALRSYEGAVVLVTHDEGAVEALGPERVLLLPDGVEDLWSDYADYRRRPRSHAVPWPEAVVAEASIRDLAEEIGRSYGFVHRILSENSTALRGRGGATRGKAKS